MPTDPAADGWTRSEFVMARKPVDVEVEGEGEGDSRYLLLTYPDGEVVRRRVDTDQKPKRRPRRPQTRLKSVRPSGDAEEGASSA